MQKPDIEQCLFLHQEEALPSRGSGPDYGRLYFGSEFCPWTFPRTAAIRTMIGRARERGWHFTLATPVLSDPFIPILSRTLAAIAPALIEGDEILISDLGGIETVRNVIPEATLILGRVMSGQKRGPQIEQMKLNSEQLEYFRQGSWYSGESAAILQQEGIRRIELDNLLQGIAPVTNGLKATLHTPYAMVTSSRSCPYRQDPAASVCAGGCGEVFTLASPEGGPLLYQGGNTQFIRIDRLPADLQSLGIDRVVHHPHLPR